MLKLASALAAVAVIATLTALLPQAAEARDRAAIRACGGPARNYNQCIEVCGCMGGKACSKRCGAKDFSTPRGKKRAMKRGGGKGGGGPGRGGGGMRGGFR